MAEDQSGFLPGPVETALRKTACPDAIVSVASYYGSGSVEKHI